MAERRLFDHVHVIRVFLSGVGLDDIGDGQELDGEVGLHFEGSEQDLLHELFGVLEVFLYV